MTTAVSCYESRQPLCHKRSRGVWVPCFRRDDPERGAQSASQSISEFQKFRLPTEANQFTDSHRPPHRGALRNVINAGRDAVDAVVPLTNGADADGEVVWF